MTLSRVLSAIIAIALILHHRGGGAAGLPDDFGAIGRACSTLWRQMSDEWHANGGGVLGSLRATREQIASDKKSKLARMVREIWKDQNSISTVELWSWPIDASDHLRLMESTSSTLDSEISNPDCRALVWLQSQLLYDILVDGPEGLRRLPEVPAHMEWASPWAQQWIEYWIFVRIE